MLTRKPAKERNKYTENAGGYNKSLGSGGIYKFFLGEYFFEKSVESDDDIKNKNRYADSNRIYEKAKKRCKAEYYNKQLLLAEISFKPVKMFFVIVSV